MAVSYLDLARLNKPLKAELLGAFEESLAKGEIALATTVRTFESNFARFVNTQQAVGVASGTDSILLTLQALGLTQGDEVICPAFGPISTIQSILRLGATVVFVDINDNMTIDVEGVRAALTERTKAIVAIHLFGLSVEIDVLAQIATDYGIFLVEDCSQACGAEWAGRALGTFGIAGCFDFQPGTNLGGLGNGGMVITENDELADRVRLFRDLGRQEGDRYITIGYDSHLDPIHAAMLDLRLPSLQEDNEDRLANATFYDGNLNKEIFTLPPLRDDASHVYSCYNIRHPHRNALRSFLAERQIETRANYALPLHVQPCFEFLGYREGHFPLSEQAANSVLSLPVFPGLTRHELDEVTHTLDLYAKTHPLETSTSS